MKSFTWFFFHVIPSFLYCLCNGIKYKKGWNIVGSFKVIKKSWLRCLLLKQQNGTIEIGEGFSCINTITGNEIGIIQPCVFNIQSPGSKLIIGDNVGISGSTICAKDCVTIGDNVLIGSGCLITDSDAHPIYWEDRRRGCNDKIVHLPVTIGNDVFLGARCIVLKGVTIGDRVVVGAGSVVTHDIPSDCIAAGNPASIIKHLK